MNEPIDILLFGGRGDLAQRKLIPALFQLHKNQTLAPTSRIIGLSRGNISSEEYCNILFRALEEYSPKGVGTTEQWSSFSKRISFLMLDGNSHDDFIKLSQMLKEEQTSNRLFYLATQPSLYVHICRNLAENNLITESSRVILEKPIGQDLKTAQDINRHVSTWFKEEQIYRIDHYLGKETVQNLLILRFANSLFESQWNNNYIDHIQITIAEKIGVGSRGSFFEQVGTMRDMVQNHLLQLLCIIAMEPPYDSSPDAIRDEKLKVLKALKPIKEEALHNNVVRGQYSHSTNDTEMLRAYQDEDDVPANSNMETFVALKAEIDNWRWAGVPFYLRTGRRMATSLCEIVVEYKKIPHSIFSSFNSSAIPNKLVIRLQPDESIKLRICEKRMGPGMNIQPTELNLSPDRSAGEHPPTAYERLLHDAINANATLFMRRDELEAAWKWVDPIIEDWNKTNNIPSAYPAGSWGPAASTLLLAKDGRLWNEMS
ncbi:MAG: glucose-6-phosphate dehydrogenase [Pseudomonadales bacterium]|nr:glucose-6-phosphate dehydrogenase [Pseudomonadales bacterium]